MLSSDIKFMCLESTYSLREVGAGHFSALFANAFPSGHNNTIIKSGNRGTQARDKDKAKKAVIGFDYHDYFPQESWPFILRDIGFRKVGLQSCHAGKMTQTYPEIARGMLPGNRTATTWPWRLRCHATATRPR